MKSQKKVMIFGTFDYFHAGHEDLIKQAKKHGDYLIVVIARDGTVEKIKGNKPDHNAKKRLSILKKHELIDKAVIGEKGDKHKIILKYKPNVIALGYDQFVFTYTLNKLIIDNKLNTEIVRLEAYKPEVFKSSKIKAKLANET
ncbi:MAG: adenylyltransferase/cytidyltransferase family protein [Candidatus Peregrinibacteria bacterium]|nr:adenylyltransferase/cytidyltransferase family protein [Candidatus Peregrinibacteria bacterium]MDZ4245038.1 adenylyltransferase/cytidyltransferase family protein [Candidatus Gracilibacteria bacterium]